MAEGEDPFAYKDPVLDDMHIQAKTNDRKVRRFGDILASLSRETKLKMRLRE